MITLVEHSITVSRSFSIIGHDGSIGEVHMCSCKNYPIVISRLNGPRSFVLGRALMVGLGHQGLRERNCDFYL